jgi:hypothetical protein
LELLNEIAVDIDEVRHHRVDYRSSRKKGGFTGQLHEVRMLLFDRSDLRK